MKQYLTAVVLLLSMYVGAQEKKPKLVVGIVVDQMRQDYLYRFSSRFSNNGFNRFIESGFMAKNMHYNYVPTYTGPGHSSIYTGTTPKYHGIVANNWFSRKLNKEIYCAYDSTQQTIGAEGNAGLMSPHNLTSSTITDELLLATNFKAKVVGLSIKDRGAIFPAGHNPNGGAFWYDKASGKLVTSTYYMNELPQWASKFNELGKADEYLDKTWNTLYPIATYEASEGDEQPYEYTLRGRETSTFPYDLKKYRNINGNFGLLPTTPFGNTWVVDASIEAVKGEELGKDEITDFLAISFSSTDYIGHAFGPRSIEIEDTYLRLDQELSRLFAFLDNAVGEGEYLVFLTSDHGAADIPQFSMKHRIPGGELPYKSVKKALDIELKNTFGDNEWVLYMDNDQVYFNHDLLHKTSTELEEIQEVTIKFLNKQPEFLYAIAPEELLETTHSDYLVQALEQGYNQQQSGDVLIVPKPGFIAKRKVGTTHGSGYSYDTHVPLLFYGTGIEKRHSVKRYAITDIAPTLSMILNIELPSGCTGNPIEEICK